MYLKGNILSASSVFLLVGLGLFVGFFREVYLAYAFGTSVEVEVFRIGFGLPSVLSDSLAVSYVAVLLPFIASTKSTGLRQELANIYWTSFAVAVGIAFLGVISLKLQAQFFAPGFSAVANQKFLETGFFYWLMFLLVILSLPLRAWMSFEKQVWPAASSQLVRSGAFLLCLVFAGWAFSLENSLLLAISALFAGICVLLVHLIALGSRRRKELVKIVLTAPDPNASRTILAALAVVFFSQIIWNAGRLIDRSLATNIEAGVLASVEYSYAIVMAVGAILGTSTNIFLAPRISSYFSEHGKVANNHVKLIAAVFIIALLLGVFISLGANSIVASILEYGAFTSEDTSKTAQILSIHALGIGPLVLALILMQLLLLCGLKAWIIPVSIVKLLAKVLTLFILSRDGISITELTFSMVISEFVSMVFLCLLVSTRS